MDLLKNGNENAYFNRKKRGMEDGSLIAWKGDSEDRSETLCVQTKSSNFNKSVIPSFNLNSLEI